jgi:hypothetical protein
MCEEDHMGVHKRVVLKEVPRVVASEVVTAKERPWILGGGLRPANGLDWQAAGAMALRICEAIGASTLLLSVLHHLFVGP